MKNVNTQATNEMYSYKSPNIVVLGKRNIQKTMMEFKDKYNLEFKFTSFDNLSEKINKNTVSIIIDENEIGEKPREFIESLLRKFKLLPIFYLSRSNQDAQFYKELYSKGLQGVIKWPSEAQVLFELLIESLKPHPNASGVCKADEMLSDMVKSHLMLIGDFEKIIVRVVDGNVFLSGRVRSLYEKRQLEFETSKVLGVKKIISNDLVVKKSKKISDKEIARKIKLYIGNTLGTQKRALGVRVKNKNVTLEGYVAEPKDILPIEEFAMKQASVQKISRNVNYRPSLVKRYTGKAKYLEGKIKNLFTGVKHVSIKLYGETAEVSGIVKAKALRSIVEKYLFQVLPVKKVINKIYIS